MGYMTIQEASEKWGISERRIQTLCAQSRLNGAKKFGRQWAIPDDLEKPYDARIKDGRYKKDRLCEEITNKNAKGRKRIPMSDQQSKPGITPEDVLQQIEYNNIRDVIPNQTYDFVDFFCGAGGMSYGFHKMEELTGRFGGPVL